MNNNSLKEIAKSLKNALTTDSFANELQAAREREPKWQSGKEFCLIQDISNLQIPGIKGINPMFDYDKILHT